MPGMDSLVKQLRLLIQEEINKGRTFETYVVTDVNKDGDYTVNVVHPTRTLAWDKVPVLGLGLGNVKGVMKLPKAGDWVLLGFLKGSSVRPICLGTLFDVFTQSPDNIPVLLEDQLLIMAQENGSYISMNPDGSITVNGAGTGGIAAGAKFKLYADGSFKFFNKDNYGIECSSTGAITLRGVTINSTQTAGTWP